LADELLNHPGAKREPLLDILECIRNK